MDLKSRYTRLITASTLLGIGFGGFLDGIVFHQLLQTHSMLSANYPRTDVVNLEINMFWDGLFHAFCWLMSAAGLALLWNNLRDGGARMSSRVMVGGMACGWGLFNLVEGIIDHHLLHLHHVVESLGVSAFDYAFLASGIILMGLGAASIRAGLPGAQLRSVQA